MKAPLVVLVVMVCAAIVLIAISVWKLLNAPTVTIVETREDSLNQESLYQESATSNTIAGEVSMVEEKRIPDDTEKELEIETASGGEESSDTHTFKTLFPKDNINYLFFLRVEELLGEDSKKGTYHATIVQNPIGFDVPIVVDSKTPLKIGNNYKVLIFHDGETKSFIVAEAYDVTSSEPET